MEEGEEEEWRGENRSEVGIELIGLFQQARSGIQDEGV